MHDSAPPKGLQGCKQTDCVNVVVCFNRLAACPLRHVLHTDSPGSSFAGVWRQPASKKSSAPAQAKSAITTSCADHTSPNMPVLTWTCLGRHAPKQRHKCYWILAGICAILANQVSSCRVHRRVSSFERPASGIFAMRNVRCKPLTVAYLLGHLCPPAGSPR